MSSVSNPIPAHPPRSVSRSASYVIISSFASKIINVAITVLLRRLLGPTLIGIWNFLDVVKGYMGVATLGVGYSVEREIPIRRAQGKVGEENRLRSFLFSYSVIEGIVVSILFEVLVFAGVIHFPGDDSGWIHLVPPLYLAQKFISCYQISLRSLNAYKRYSMLNLVCDTMDWSLLGCAYFWGLPGLLWGSVVNGIAKVLLCTVFTAGVGIFKLRWSLSLEDFKELFSFGISSSIFKVASTTMQYIDSLFVSYQLGVTGLGYYYLGRQIASSMLEVPFAFTQVGYTHFSTLLGVNPHPQGLVDTLREQRKILLFLAMPVALMAGYFGAEFLTTQILPRFMPALPTVRVLVLTTLLMGMRQLYLQPLMVTKRVTLVTIITVIPALIFLGMFFLLQPWISDTLLTVALSVCISESVYFLLAAYCCLIVTEHTNKNALKEIGLELLLLSFWAGLILGVDYLVGPLQEESLLKGIWGSLLKTLLFLGVGSVLVVYRYYFAPDQKREKI